MQQLIWQTVAMIPKGKVASYGQIARLIGYPNHSRYVGTTLKNLPRNSRLPWFRVVNSNLKISQRGGGAARQKRLLLAEDVNFVGEKIARAHQWEAHSD
ncbi:MAG: methylated-DNA--[protein]-cysteine S-methyltransferase [Pseudomonadales bacterium]